MCNLPELQLCRNLIYSTAKHYTLNTYIGLHTVLRISDYHINWKSLKIAYHVTVFRRKATRSWIKRLHFKSIYFKKYWLWDPSSMWNMLGINFISNDILHDRFWMIPYFTILRGWGWGFQPPKKFLLKFNLGTTTCFCILMNPFNEFKNKKGCSTNVMVCLKYPLLLVDYNYCCF